MSKKVPTTEDSALFREVVGEVRPLKNDKVVLEKPKLAAKPRREWINQEPWPVERPTGGIDIVGIDDYLAYIVPEVPKKWLEQLEKGVFVPEAEIDLHGLTSHQASLQLQDFLRIGVKGRCRCVQIVHGKGYRSQDHYPILKNHINHWLRHHPDVLAFCSALPKDGGTGAAYVLLRVRR